MRATSSKMGTEDKRLGHCAPCETRQYAAQFKTSRNFLDCKNHPLQSRLLNHKMNPQRTDPLPNGLLATWPPFNPCARLPERINRIRSVEAVSLSRGPVLVHGHPLTAPCQAININLFARNFRWHWIQHTKMPSSCKDIRTSYSNFTYVFSSTGSRTQTNRLL